MAITAIPTFHCISLVWGVSGGGSSSTASVRYRPNAIGTFIQGHPLWWAGGEYRGSLVYLQSNTQYEIELSLPSGVKETVLVRTWNETFPIGQTITLPATSSSQLNITASGTANGYLLYRPAGTSAIINVNNGTDYGINITGQYVIVRGVTVIGARQHCVFIDATNDVVLESCDLSVWGEEADIGIGINRQGCIEVDGARRVVVQGCRVHNPRWDSNAWTEPSQECSSPECHPQGPHYITFRSGGPPGNHVIRYNSFYTDATHYCNDGIAAGGDFDNNPCFDDTDIYGNYIERCWDNPIQAEGANINIRVFENFIDLSYSHIACDTAASGPAYFFRNFSNQSDYGPPAIRPDASHRTRMFKAGGSPAGKAWRAYFYHNTVLQPIIGGVRHGPTFGLGQTHTSGLMVSRNNIWDSDFGSIDASSGNGNDFDWDLCSGDVPSGHENNGIMAAPTYAAGTRALAPGTPGYDAGLRIPNFNDDFVGTAPDMGAQENGGRLIRWGVEAFGSSLGTGNPMADTIIIEECVASQAKYTAGGGINIQGTQCVVRLNTCSNNLGSGIRVSVSTAHADAPNAGKSNTITLNTIQNNADKQIKFPTQTQADQKQVCGNTITGTTDGTPAQAC